MTTNELLLRECRSFHAMIGRLEQIIKGMPELALEQVVKEANQTAADKSPESGRQTSDGECAAIPAAVGFCSLKQASLFDGMESGGAANGMAANGGSAASPDTPAPRKNATPAKKGAETVKKPRRGTPIIGRAEAMANYRKRAAGREILDLKDVNLIFGYNESTSGTFISCAIRRGDLMTIRYGQHTKFLAKDVKDFIKRWYAQQPQQGE